MKRVLIAVTWLMMLTAARAADIATTYHFSPSLSQDANPIVAVLGGGWIALLVPNVLLCALISLFTIAYYRAKPYSDLIPPSHSAWDFAALGLYGRTMTKRQFITRQLLSISLPPKGHRAMLCQLIGFAFPPAIIAGSFWAVFAWFASREWHLSWFIHLHSHLGYALAIIPGLLVFFVMEAVYFVSEYERALDNACRNNR